MATDRFTANLKCPVCGKMGVAHLEQEDGWAFAKGAMDTTIADFTDGFVIKPVPKGVRPDYDFACVDHPDISACR